MTCSLCGVPALHPFTIGLVRGHLCARHAESLESVITKFIRSEMQAQRRASRELEAELLPRVRRSA
jgi:protein-arginine kinase